MPSRVIQAASYRPCPCRHRYALVVLRIARAQLHLLPSRGLFLSQSQLLCHPRPRLRCPFGSVPPLSLPLCFLGCHRCLLFGSPAGRCGLIGLITVFDVRLSSRLSNELFIPLPKPHARVCHFGSQVNCYPKHHTLAFPAARQKLRQPCCKQ